MSKVRYPFGEADVITIDDGDLSSAQTIENTKTLIDISGLTAAAELDLDIDEELIPGSELYVKVSQGAAGYNVTLGDGFDTDCPDLTGDANDIDAAEFIYDGTAFQPKGPWQKVKAVV